MRRHQANLSFPSFASHVLETAVLRRPQIPVRQCPRDSRRDDGFGNLAISLTRPEFAKTCASSGVGYLGIAYAKLVRNIMMVRLQHLYAADLRGMFL